MNGAALIAAERRRQIDVEGFGPDHDDRHHFWHLLAAASCYRNCAGPHDRDVPYSWPWESSAWKPKTRLRNLVRAGALYQAAADHQIRRAGSAAPPILHLVEQVGDEIDRLIAAVVATAQEAGYRLVGPADETLDVDVAL